MFFIVILNYRSSFATDKQAEELFLPDEIRSKHEYTVFLYLQTTMQSCIGQIVKTYQFVVLSNVYIFWPVKIQFGHAKSAV